VPKEKAGFFGSLLPPNENPDIAIEKENSWKRLLQ
jgi:hypothetical protein